MYEFYKFYMFLYKFYNEFQSSFISFTMFYMFSHGTCPVGDAGADPGSSPALPGQSTPRASKMLFLQ